MSAKLIPQRGEHLRAERFILPRRKAHQKRKREDRRGNICINRLLHGPASFAGIFDKAANIFQIVSLLRERPLGKLEQPRTHDAALIPQRGDLVQVESRQAKRLALAPGFYGDLEVQSPGYQNSHKTVAASESNSGVLH